MNYKLYWCPKFYKNVLLFVDLKIFHWVVQSSILVEYYKLIFNERRGNFVKGCTSNYRPLSYPSNFDKSTK